VTAGPMVPVFLAAVPWAFALPQRARFLCHALLASGRPCLHVDIPRRSAPLTWLRHPRVEAHVLRPGLADWRSWWALSEPEQRTRAARRGHRLRRRLTARHRPESLVAIVETPQWLPWLAALGIEHIVYDRIDEVPAHAPGPGLDERIERWEAELIDRCTAAVVTGSSLAQPIRTRRPELPIRRIPNGVDAEAFERLATLHAPPPELARLHRPLVGFIGALYHWVDVELIDAVTLALPDVDFAFIGPAQGAHKPASRPNVHPLGPVSHERVPACIASFDVAWVPFRDSAVGRAANPLKVYEYLALGKPVVTTPLADLEDFAGLVSVGKNATEIVSLLCSALDSRGREGAEKRRALARSCSWARRADALIEYLDEVTSGQG